MYTIPVTLLLPDYGLAWVGLQPEMVGNYCAKHAFHGYWKGSTAVEEKSF
jgi:hypothetical protein